jgi:sec-independent protein translocase protein TatA
MLLALLGAMLGTVEIIIIVAVILLVFGPSKLPALGEGIGKMLRGFKKEIKAMDEDKAKDEAKAKAKQVEADKDEDSAGEIDVTPKGESEGAERSAQ